ncbi:MAG: glycosyltransferase family 2 protein [Lachnospiraceae bacterium]|nr:glycosyltransferase family 2 protein [Lachnospiraceae bacterium]
MPYLTIHTATYNRAYILPEAYKSLCAQTNKDFEWIITDDGSTDNTKELVENWIKEADFPIVYNPLTHVGIPRALNSGISKASTKWFMMLDSDDHILPETVEKVIGWLKEIENDNRFAGIGFARCFPNGEFMKNQTPIMVNGEYTDCTHIERKKYHLDMDMCEVHRVSLFRKYPFQYWPTEKYAPEQLNFYEIALAGYLMRWRAEKLYICEYLLDGQTKDDKLVKNNPMGFAMMYNQLMKIDSGFKSKCRNAMRMTALSLYAKEPGYLLKSSNIGYTILTLPLGIALAVRRNRQYSKLK